MQDMANMSIQSTTGTLDGIRHVTDIPTGIAGERFRLAF